MTNQLNGCPNFLCLFLIQFSPLSPLGWRGIVVTGQGGRGGGGQTRGTHDISVTAWRIFAVPSSVELSSPVVVHCYGHLPICSKNCHKLGPDFVECISLKPLDGFTHLKFHGLVYTCSCAMSCHSYLPICPIWACTWAKILSNQAALGPDFAVLISLKRLDGFVPFEVLWNRLYL